MVSQLLERYDYQLVIVGSAITIVVMVIVHLIGVITHRKTARSFRNKQTEVVNITEQSAMLKDFLTIAVSDNIVDITEIDLDTFKYHFIFHEDQLSISAMEGELDWRELMEILIPRIHPLDRPKVLDAVSTKVLSGYNLGVVKSFRFRMSYNIKNHTYSSRGKYYWYTSTVRIWNRNGHKSAILSTIDDTVAIEEERKRQDMLEDALKNARRAGQAKSTFLFNMSHDIRTPMNAILGFTAIAKKHFDEPDKVEDCLEKIENSGNHLLRLINDILEMSSIEYGKTTMDPQPCDLMEKMEKVASMIIGPMEKKNLVFEYKAEITDRYVLLDELRIDQVILNLLGNAVKFTPDGGHIDYTLMQCGRDDAGKIIYEWHIKDNGIGIDPEFQKVMFDPFERERSSTDSGIQGTGLGLAITSSLVKLMGGTIHVNSQKGIGSEFVVSIPLELAEEKQIENIIVSGNYDLAGKRILLVEDNELNKEIAEELLRDEGFKVETASDGATAVKKVMNAEADYYDVILMDIQMPIMDGYQATRTIRNLEDTRKAAVPIIAMTANAFEEDKKRALECGMQAHIAKPIIIENLLEAISQNIK